MSEERRDVRAKVREYEKDGQTKSVYATIGSAEVSDHGSVIKVYLDTLPLKFDGRLYINKPYEKKDDYSKDVETLKNIAEVKDELPDMNHQINIADVPF